MIGYLRISNPESIAIHTHLLASNVAKVHLAIRCTPLMMAMLLNERYKPHLRRFNALIPISMCSVIS